MCQNSHQQSLEKCALGSEREIGKAADHRTDSAAEIDFQVGACSQQQKCRWKY